MFIEPIAVKIREWSLVRSHLTVKQFIKFAFSGILSTIPDFFIYIVLTRFSPVHYLWANFIALVCGATVNFSLNKTWTFRNRERRFYLQYVKFWLVTVSGLLVAQYLLYLFVEKLTLYDIIAKIIAAIIVMFYRFLAQKYWVFRTHNS